MAVSPSDRVRWSIDDLFPSHFRVVYVTFLRMKVLNITTGCGGGNYCPKQTVTRDQMAAFLARAFLGM